MSSLPERFLLGRCPLSDMQPPSYGYCVAYENGAWRTSQFAEHIIEWVPDFVLSAQDLATLSSGNMVHKMREAARFVYTTSKYARRGEFGELILHAILRQFFHTSTAVNKLYYKDSANDTVKGFDAVHVTESGGELHLWLGEAKFYTSLAGGIREAAESIEAHLDSGFLRAEFSVIMRRLDETEEWVDRLRDLLHRHRPLQEIFTSVIMPVMVTYDSDAVAAHTDATDQYDRDFKSEIEVAQKLLAAKDWSADVSIVGLFVPLASKTLLISELDGRLKHAQGM